MWTKHETWFAVPSSPKRMCLAEVPYRKCSNLRHLIFIPEIVKLHLFNNPYKHKF